MRPLPSPCPPRSISLRAAPLHAPRFHGHSRPLTWEGHSCARACACVARWTRTGQGSRISRSRRQGQGPDPQGRQDREEEAARRYVPANEGGRAGGNEEGGGVGCVRATLRSAIQPAHHTLPVRFLPLSAALRFQSQAATRSACSTPAASSTRCRRSASPAYVVLWQPGRFQALALTTTFLPPVACLAQMNTAAIQAEKRAGAAAKPAAAA